MNGFRIYFGDEYGRSWDRDFPGLTIARVDTRRGVDTRIGALMVASAFKYVIFSKRIQKLDVTHNAHITAEIDGRHVIGYERIGSDI